jgi:hypothetical protein
MSAEHVLGNWMNQLFAGKGLMRYEDGGGRKWEAVSPEIDWRAKVVCAKCNNGWMSTIENEHAKPVLTPLIEDADAVPLTASIARSLAIFTFKTAVVLDHAHKNLGEPYFGVADRNAFRQHLTIPDNTAMWMGRFAGHRRKVKTQTVHHAGNLTPTQPLKMYVFTCAIGCLVLQLVHAKVSGIVGFEPLSGFEYTMAPFWPKLYPDLIWPFQSSLTTDSEFDALRDRWRTIAPMHGEAKQ